MGAQALPKRYTVTRSTTHLPGVRFGLVLALGLAVFPRPADSKGKIPTLVEWMSLSGADNPSISPDGRSVAYHIRSADWEADGFDDEIWIVDVASRKRYQLTNTKGPNRGQSWSPVPPSDMMQSLNPPM